MRANVGNLASYEEDQLVDGTYEVEVTKVEHKESERTGTEGTTLFMKVQDGPDLESGEPSQGQNLIMNLWWPNSGMKDGGKFSGIQLRKACEAAGVTFDETGFDEEDFVGAVVAAKVKNSEYNGETRPEVKSIRGL